MASVIGLTLTIGELIALKYSSGIADTFSMSSSATSQALRIVAVSAEKIVILTSYS